ncbi:MAG: GEVED domain-containing protein [bacterium]|nr:GEVED domain-containing protein [bacterium]
MLPVLRITKSYLVVTFMLTCAVHAQHRKPKSFHDQSHEPLCNAHQELLNRNSKQSIPISGVLENSHRADSSCNWDTPNYQSFANLTPEEIVDQVKTFTRKCTASWLFDYNSNHSPTIFSDDNLLAVIQSFEENAQTYDGTYSSGMYGYLFYLHAALYHDWYEDDINISQDLINSLVEPIELMSENPNLYDFSEPALETLYELTIVMDVRTVRHTQGATKIIKDILKNIVTEENWKDVPEELYFEYGSAYNNIHFNISRGVYNQDTLYHQVLSTDSELFDLMGQLGVYKELKEFERFSYLVENVPWTLKDPAAVEILNELSIDQIDKIYNAKLYERLEIEWIYLVFAVLDYGDCSTINVCDESSEQILDELNNMLFPNLFTFDNGKMVVRTSLPIEEVQTLYYAAKQVQASFFRLLQNDNPLPEDTNDVLNMVIYGSPEEYDEYQYFLNELPTDNGGIYIEVDATFYTYDRTPEQSIYTLEELFRHEYVHYLQARFLINGSFGETEFYRNGRLTWFNEGMAEFIAGSTSRDGIKIRETILDRIESDGSERMEVNNIIGATYDDGFKFYRYGCLLWSYWYDNDRDFYQNIFDLVISDDLEGYDLLLETLKSDENLQNVYNKYIDQNIADDNSWQPITEWLTDNNLMADSPGELNIESTNEVTINNIGLGETEMNKRFRVTGTLELLEPNEEDNIIDQFEAKLNEFLITNSQDESVNNLYDAVAYFEDIDTEANIAQFIMTGPLRKGSMLPPIAEFSAGANVINVNGSIKYLDKTENTGIDFSWEFEGGEPSTSTAKNPIVAYSEPGLYNVKLTATNEAGTSEISKSSYVMVLNSELEGYCETNNTSSENYISSVQFGAIQNRSEWENYTQTNWFTSLLPSDTIPLKVSTPWLESGTDHTLGVWIDWNQNSVFGDEEEETIINLASIEEPLDMQVIVPESTKGGLTKMRVRINNWSDPSQPCGDDTIGEVEDYYIFVGTGEEKPIADFDLNKNLIVNEGTVDFIDQSNYFPIAWSWNFENANLSTSNARNPSVSFEKLGLHEVTLEVENKNGVSEIRQSKHILLTEDITTDHCPASHSDGDNYITRVQFGDINVASEWDGYSLNGNYFAHVDTSETHQLSISTAWLEGGSSNTIGVWIDWNQNSIFGDDEEETIINVASIEEPVNMQVTVPSNAKSGITKMRVRINNWSQPSQPCGNDTIGEVEDYIIFVGTGEEKPIADFNFNRNLIIEEGTVDFTDNSKHFPIGWSWTFEEANPSTSEERNPSVSYNKLGLYEVTLEVENEKGISETKQSTYILVTEEIAFDHCQVSHTDGDNYITRVQFGDINMSSEWEGYSLNEDYFALVDTSEIYELNINTLWSELGFDHTLGVWIDWNEDGDFEDSEETIFNDPSALGPYAVNVIVPSNATTGLKKMRLRINNWSDPSEPCGEDTIGEVEDYLLWVRGTSEEDDEDDDQIVTSTSINEDEIKLFPNPGNGKITITPNTATESFSVVLYNTTGKIVDYQIIRNAKESYQLDYSHLSTGVYHIKIINQGAVFKKKLIISR